MCLTPVYCNHSLGSNINVDINTNRPQVAASDVAADAATDAVDAATDAAVVAAAGLRSLVGWTITLDTQHIWGKKKFPISQNPLSNSL